MVLFFIIPNVRTKYIFDNKNICCRTNVVLVNLFSGGRVFNTDELTSPFSIIIPLQFIDLKLQIMELFTWNPNYYFMHKGIIGLFFAKYKTFYYIKKERSLFKKRGKF